MHLEQEVNQQISDLLREGIIENSDSPYNNPLVLVRKKNGKLRMCVDFRRLNSITNREIYPIPSGPEIFDRLSGNKFFTTIDLSKGYYQIKLDSASQKKTAFSTSAGHFHFTRLPFGLTSAPTSFQSVLEKILRNENQTKCAIYIDDIIIFGKDRTEHDKNLIDVLSKLKKSGVKLSKEKFEFCQSRVKYLGHIISQDGIETDPDKLRAVRDWPRPNTVKELNSFLGFANYYRKFIKSFSKIAYALEKNVRKDKSAQTNKLEWTEEMLKSFENLKTALSNPPVLHSPNSEDTFLLDVDASKFAIGAVLSQVDSNGVERPIYFASNKLSSAEQNYCTTRRELLAVIRYVKFFHHYLAGKKFIIRSDHRSLSWLMKWKIPLSSQYFRWISILQEYEFTINHREGKHHLNADALSRLVYCRQCKTDHLNALSQATNTDKNNLYQLVERAHRFLAHLGSSNLHRYLSIFFPNMDIRKICKEVCKRCILCLKRKSVKSIKVPPGSITATDSLQKLCIDIAGPFPNCKDYRYILVIVDTFSNYPCIVPLKSLRSVEIAKAIEVKWISTFGSPKQIHSDNAPYFSGPEIKKMASLYNIQLTHSSPYYPQANGKVERFMRTIKDMVFACYHENGWNWPMALSRIEMVLRGTLHDKCGITPFQYIFGKPMVIGKEAQSVEQKIDFSALYKRIKTEKERSEKPVERVQVGSYVMVKKFPILKSIYEARYSGPFKVVDVKGHGKCITVIDESGNKVVRNIRHIKLLEFPYEEQSKKLKYEANENYTSDKKKCQSVLQRPNTYSTNRYPKRITIPTRRFGFSQS